jgi:hypothetical protein
VLVTAGTASAQVPGPRYTDWAEPAHLGTVVNSPLAEFFPAISKDGLSLYFTGQSCSTAGLPAGCRPSYGGWDIYVTARPTVDDAWGPAQNVGPAINTAADEVGPYLSVDGHHLLFASNRPGGFGGNDIYRARRHDRRDDFGWRAPRNLGSGVNGESNDAAPALFVDDETGATYLYFDSNRPEGPGPYTEDAVHNGNDIWVSVLQPDGQFGPASLVEELSTPYADRRPSIRRDGLEMFLTSDRPGCIGVIDIWVSTRLSTEEPWSAPVNLGTTINAAGNNAGPALSFDGKELYFQASKTSRPVGLGAYDLFVATRTRVKGAGRNRCREQVEERERWNESDVERDAVGIRDRDGHHREPR